MAHLGYYCWKFVMWISTTRETSRLLQTNRVSEKGTALCGNMCLSK